METLTVAGRRWANENADELVRVTDPTTMSGWSILLDVESSAESATTIRECFSYVEQKRAEHCTDEDPLSIARDRERAIQRYKEAGQFHVSAHVYRELAHQIQWADIEAVMDDWIVADERIRELVSVLREGTDDLLQSTEDPAWNYTCYTETGPVALCEFALENGYAIWVLD